MQDHGGCKARVAIRARLEAADYGRRESEQQDVRTLTLYRDDSTVQVVYERVKATFWTAGNTVFVISQYLGNGPEHRYIHWPRERFCWFKDEHIAAPERSSKA